MTKANCSTVLSMLCYQCKYNQNKQTALVLLNVFVRNRTTLCRTKGSAPLHACCRSTTRHITIMHQFHNKAQTYALIHNYIPANSITHTHNTTNTQRF